MKRLLSLLLLIAGPALAAPETFVIDPAHTAPWFSYNHLGFSTQTHRFDRVSGKVVLDRAARSASVEVSIDAKSVNTGYPLFNEHIQGEDFFDTAHHPVITYRSTQVRFEGDRPVAVDGLLTIKGVTRPVTLEITHFHQAMNPIRKKEAIGANAVASVKRSDFGMGKFAPGVSDEVRLDIALEALKE